MFGEDMTRAAELDHDLTSTDQNIKDAYDAGADDN